MLCTRRTQNQAMENLHHRLPNAQCTPGLRPAQQITSQAHPGSPGPAIPIPTAPDTRIPDIHMIGAIEESQITTADHIANLVRSDYERKAIQPSKRLIRNRLAMVTATVIHAGRWNSEALEENMLLPAIADGRINRQQADQLEDADCIIRCEDQDGNVIHAVAEISITVQDTDRRRAAELAEILAAVAGTPAVPFVVGQEEETPSAEAPNVAFLAYTG